MTASVPASAGSNPVDSSRRLEDDRPVSLRFFGSADADLLTHEFEESFQGVLRKNFVGKTANGFPAGFVGASPRGQIWGGTMWSRDGGTFLRELVMRGYYEHAAMLAECLIGLVGKNQEGFYSFPMFFKGSNPGTVDWPPGMTNTRELVVPRSGTELDGTASIVIGMVLLWERLPVGDPTKNHIREFLFQDASPVNYLKSCLKSQPLVPGSGEFGGGMGSPGDYYNVVQNNLSMLALLAAANMAEESGRHGLAEDDRQWAAKVRDGMEKYLVDQDGGWLWCIDPKTLKPDPAVNDSEANRGFGGLNGVACMYSDVLGFEPLTSSWQGIQHCEKTFDRLYQTPLRQQQFQKYGIWTQFDVLARYVCSKLQWEGVMDASRRKTLKTITFALIASLKAPFLQGELNAAPLPGKPMSQSTFPTTRSIVEGPRSQVVTGFEWLGEQIPCPQPDRERRHFSPYLGRRRCDLYLSRRSGVAGQKQERAGL